MSTNVIYYVETNAFCVVILLLFHAQTRGGRGQISTGRMLLNRMTWAAVTLCASDLVAGIARGRFFPGARAMIEVSNLIFFEALAVIGYLWMLYVLVTLRNTDRVSGRLPVLLALPLAAFTLTALSNPFTHFLFAIDEHNRYARASGVYFHWVVVWGYLILPTALTARAIAREKNRQKRQEIAPLLFFIVAPAVASVAQMLFYGVTSTQVGITISIAMLCLAQQNNQVRSDALTGLNNRRALDSFLDGYAQRHTDASLTFLMIDIDHFKQVNDRFGHIMGDNALRDTAGALRRACKSAPEAWFLCRYGGDEFVIAGVDRDISAAERLAARIQDETERLSEANGRPYRLSVSVGMASGSFGDSRDAERLLRDADAAMYLKKNGDAAKNRE